MIRRTIFLLAAAALLAGCVPSTIQGLRDAPAGSFIFEADENYQAVYRKIVTPARNCWQQGASLLTAQIEVQAEIYSDIRQANIAIIMHGAPPFESMVFMSADLQAISDNKTRITTYYAQTGLEPRARAVELWVKQNSTECRAPALPPKE